MPNAAAPSQSSCQSSLDLEPWIAAIARLTAVELATALRMLLALWNDDRAHFYVVALHMHRWLQFRSTSYASVWSPITFVDGSGKPMFDVMVREGTDLAEVLALCRQIEGSTGFKAQEGGK